jgi:prepilin peptidase CpaA
MQNDWPSQLSTALIVISAGVLLMAALHDIVARTVPNWMSLALALFGIALRAVTGGLPMGLLAGAIVFAAAALCWRHGWLGGADVKLLGAAAIVVPPHEVLSFIAATAFAGAVLGIAYLAARHIASAPATRRPDRIVPRALRIECWRIRRGGPLPYACAIVVGFLFIVL